MKLVFLLPLLLLAVLVSSAPSKTCNLIIDEVKQMDMNYTTLVQLRSIINNKIKFGDMIKDNIGSFFLGMILIIFLITLLYFGTKYLVEKGLQEYRHFRHIVQL